MSIKQKKLNIASRFRGLLPIVVDVETTGLNPETDGLLEVAAVVIEMNDQGKLFPGQIHSFAVEPFVGANVDPESLAVTGIDPDCTLRYAVTEQQALHNIFSRVSESLQRTGCQRGVLVGHNSWFDLAFIKAAAMRCQFASFPFHSFTSFDTATLAGVALGETVLAKSLRAARISFDLSQAHSAAYDAAKTAELFCFIVNGWRS